MPRAVINASVSGDTVIIAAASASGYNITRVFCVAAGLVNVIFKEGTTNMTGAIPLQTGGVIALSRDVTPWFIINKAQAFNINLSANVQVGGWVEYEYF